MVLTVQFSVLCVADHSGAAVCVSQAADLPGPGAGCPRDLWAQPIHHPHQEGCSLVLCHNIQTKAKEIDHSRFVGCRVCARRLLQNMYICHPVSQSESTPSCQFGWVYICSAGSKLCGVNPECMFVWVQLSTWHWDRNSLPAYAVFGRTTTWRNFMDHACLFVNKYMQAQSMHGSMWWCNGKYSPSTGNNTIWVSP